ncbi:GlsB/YeaQ/YmgE family stress response membrane protein [Tessaracoccus sp. MC1627]|uniref:GlsB/YeaQ/YmgE family stress response membrane protein n=1 Tax=Tessaracoccus sp. MC1627 TaxID=2760312 RepID=UPI0016037165|nr:GlsB/YeaQ/YmgE family stress response membrane protein [Tessaracoccus sp. MC1627]MBB1514084.1 GlsB/YeaQ/YmgE family stress response membrane protein [Tessaracoccus sp. MC1627]
MGIIAWIVIGLLGGAIAKAIMPGRQGGGWIATMLLGIVGAFVGGLLGSLIFEGRLDLTGPDFSIGGLITSIVGALIVLAVYGWMQKRKA